MTWKGARSQGCQVCSCQGTYPNRTRASTRCIALALTQEVFQQAFQDPLGRKIRECDAWLKLNNSWALSFVQLLTLFQWMLLLEEKKSANPVSIRKSGTCWRLSWPCNELPGAWGVPITCRAVTCQQWFWFLELLSFCVQFELLCIWHQIMQKRTCSVRIPRLQKSTIGWRWIKDIQTLNIIEPL